MLTSHWRHVLTSGLCEFIFLLRWNLKQASTQVLDWAEYPLRYDIHWGKFIVPDQLGTLNRCATKFEGFVSGVNVMYVFHNLWNSGGQKRSENDLRKPPETKLRSKESYTKEQAEKGPYYDKSTRRDRLLDLWTGRYWNSFLPKRIPSNANVVAHFDIMRSIITLSSH